MGRYRLLNLVNMLNGSRPAVEFRAFAGTTNASKIISYVRLCIGLAQKAATSQRTAKFNTATVSQTSPVHRKGGEGQTQITRLLYALGWTKGRSKQVYGDILGDDLPSIETSKKALRRLAKKYDESRR